MDHRLVGSFVYNLPFGKGEKFAGDATGVKNAIVGGWQVNGIATFQRGFPMTITAADAGGLNDSFGTNRANLVGDPYPSGFEQSINAWFNTAAFAQPAPGQFGNIGRNTLRGPGINNFDLALFKNFDLGMGSRLQFRFESFNAFNHTQWNAPEHQRREPELRARARHPAGSHQPAGVEAAVLSHGLTRITRISPGQVMTLIPASGSWTVLMPDRVTNPPWRYDLPFAPFGRD